MYKKLVLFTRSLRPIVPESWKAYGCAVFCVGVAALLRWFIATGIGPLPQFATYFPAALIATLIGGIGPGMLAAVLGGIIGFFAFGLPLGSLVDVSPRTGATFVYVLSVAFVIAGAEYHRRLVRRIAAEERLRKLTVEELVHRLKNKVATIQAIIGLKLRGEPKLRDEINRALAALAAADQAILARENRGVDLATLLSAELMPYEVSRVKMCGPAVELSPKLVSTLALVFHELATNAAKHGALSEPSGNIAINWTCASGGVTLEWQEEAGPPVLPPEHEGFGSRLLSAALKPFGGVVEPRFETDGFCCRISLPALNSI